MKRRVDITGVNSAAGVVSVNIISTGMLVVVDTEQEIGRLTIQHSWFDYQENRYHLLTAKCAENLIYLVRPEDVVFFERISLEKQAVAGLTTAFYFELPNIRIRCELREVFALDDTNLNLLYAVHVQRTS